MQLDMEIGTTVHSWRLGVDDGLDVWLRRCPWRSGEVSQMRVLRLASQHEADRIQLEIRRLVYAADEGVYSPKVLLSGPSQAAGLISMLTACVFGEPRSLDRFSFKRLILDRLKQAPHVFQLVKRSGDPGELLEEMLAFLEELNREECLYPLIVLVLSEGIQLVRRPDCFDTAPAMPDGRILNPRNLDPCVLWGGYLHSRAAWECGGDIRLAQIYGSAWNGISQSDDVALEESCSLLAAERWREVSAARKAEWQQYLAKSCRPLEANGYGDTIGVLVEEGLLWQPPGQCRLMPTAWAVRATAGQVRSGVLSRAALVNSVLVAEVLGWCFQLEALEREQYAEACDWSEADESKTLHASFVAKDRSSAAFLYPENYPLSLSFKEFETFGGFCRRLGTNPRADTRRRLLSLRNALCHGHYAGWKTIEALLLIQARLSLADRKST